MQTMRQVLSNLTFANQLTFLRLVAVPFFAIALLNNHHTVALAIFAGAAVTDVLDGLIARILKQKTALGALLDPAADKLLLTTAVIILTLPNHPKVAPMFSLMNHLPLWLTVLTISRDLIIVLIAVILYLAYGISKFPPSILGKLTTCSLMALASLVLLYNAWEVISTRVVPGAIWATLILTLASGLHYFYRTAAVIRRE